jgi:hypothetical protein
MQEPRREENVLGRHPNFARPAFRRCHSPDRHAMAHAIDLGKIRQRTARDRSARAGADVPRLGKPSDRSAFRKAPKPPRRRLEISTFRHSTNPQAFNAARTAEFVYMASRLPDAGHNLRLQERR